MNPQTSTTTGVRIRRAGADDAPVVLTMLRELATHENSAHAVHASIDDWRVMLADPTVVVLLAFDADEPVGYVSGMRQLNLWVGRDIFAMDDLYVRAGARDRGIGGRLMAALAEHLRHEAADDPPLITWGVRDDNDDGHRFYRRLGARLRTKVVAAWAPDAYLAHLDSRPRLDPDAARASEQSTGRSTGRSKGRSTGQDPAMPR